MRSEADAIPFQADLLRGERLLVLAPHPDDEVIACGGLIAEHNREQRQVHVAVVTDGGQAGEATARQEESRRSLEILGGGTIEFWGFADRNLEENRTACAERIAAILRERRPDLVLVPSPVEFHPDHLALGVAFCEAVQGDPALFADLAVTRVAFFEVGQPLRPNALVDITAVADRKFEAVALHQSQLTLRDYVSYTRGLNAYRAMTLPPEVKFAEAYWVAPLPEIRTTPIGVLQRAMGDARGIAVVVAEPLPVSVVVRTKDRPRLLGEAIDSIRATGYPCEIVVVNDGGVPVEPAGCRLVVHDGPRGRAAAANAGVRAASHPFLAFLDDDDLFYPEHLATLARAAAGSQSPAWYTDAVSAFVRVGADGGFETRSRLRLFGADFDRDTLLVDNFIPLPTLLLRRDDFLALDGFDPAFELFEDWDFLIRLSARGGFVHVPRVTCEIRSVESAQSITMATPEGTAGFRAAKLAVWKKHEAELGPDVFANAWERQKKALGTMGEKLVERSGVAALRESEIDRLRREALYAAEKDLQIAALRGEVAGLGKGVDDLRDLVVALERQNGELETRIAEIEQERAAVAAAYDELTANHARLGHDHGELRTLFDESQTTIGALYAELARIQGLLDTIYASNTWKLHAFVQKMKGRG